MVNGKTGDVMWVMGGKRNMFQDLDNSRFAWQHDARMSGTNRFTLFDNHRREPFNGYCKKGNCSRGLEVEYDPKAMTVKTINEWYHPQNITSASQGGVQRMKDGNVLVAWGQNPSITEYTAEGKLAMDIQRGQVVRMPHGIPEIIQYRA